MQPGRHGSLSSAWYAPTSSAVPSDRRGTSGLWTTPAPISGEPARGRKSKRVGSRSIIAASSRRAIAFHVAKLAFGKSGPPCVNRQSVLSLHRTCPDTWQIFHFHKKLSKVAFLTCPVISFAAVFTYTECSFCCLSNGNERPGAGPRGFVVGHKSPCP